jgi:peptide/nickel transport system substrate-binding protein
VGNLAESWKTPELGVWVLDIRKGVHFALNPDSAASKLANGREMTAEDVAYSIEYIRDTPSSWIQLSEPLLIKSTTVERTGPWQITVRTPVNPANGYLWIMGGGGNGYIWPKEVVQKYGTSNAWQDQVGTGPYILKDFVNDSQATYKRNPNYWETDPVGPGKGNQLPYAEQVNYLVVPDLSTQLAAFRTGKVDRLAAVMLEDGQNMLKTNPKTQFYQTISPPYQVAMRMDKKDLPYKDIRVRKALMMATDMEGMKQGLYKGQAEILDSPARKLYSGVYTPLEQLPAETQELYKYNPDKAKQFLKDAGYPNGFKTRMLLPVTPSTAGDLAAVLKDMWAKVGVDVELQPRDLALYNAAFATRNFEELFFGTQPGGTGQLYTRYGNSYFRGPNNFNLSYVNDPEGTDPTITSIIDQIQKAVMVNYPKAEELTKQLNQYTLSQAFLIPTPAAYTYTLWQPWIKNYYGEGAAQYWLQYLWIDQDLKKAMGR